MARTVRIKFHYLTTVYYLLVSNTATSVSAKNEINVPTTLEVFSIPRARRESQLERKCLM